jgi:hypothetical protein
MEITAVGDPPRWLLDTLLSVKVGTNFTDKATEFIFFLFTFILNFDIYTSTGVLYNTRYLFRARGKEATRKTKT